MKIKKPSQSSKLAMNINISKPKLINNKPPSSIYIQAHLDKRKGRYDR